MRRAYRSIVVGICMLVGSFLLALLGSYLLSLPVLVLALVMGVAGAFVSLRGVIEFLSEVFAQ
jgi:uncharacterized membrane protein YccC